MATRVRDEVYQGGVLIGVLTHHRWHRLSEGELTPLEPMLSKRDAQDLEACVLARPEPDKRDPIAEGARLRIRVLDKLLSAHALERIRRTP